MSGEFLWGLPPDLRFAYPFRAAIFRTSRVAEGLRRVRYASRLAAPSFLGSRFRSETSSVARASAVCRFAA